MGIKCVKDRSNVDKIINNLKALSEKKISVGVISDKDEKLIQIAKAQEFGAHITPNQAQYLSIPLDRKYKGVSPGEVEGLFVIKSKNGNLFLVKNKNRKSKGSKTDDLEFCYFLTKEIDIPERSFIRAGFDENKSNIEEKGENLLQMLIHQDTDLDIFFETLGEYASGKIKEYLVDLKSPANSALTSKVKGSSNPLVDTGHLRDSISYEVTK